MVAYLQFQRVANLQDPTSYQIFQDKLQFTLFGADICEEETYQKISQDLTFQGQIIGDLEIILFGKEIEKINPILDEEIKNLEIGNRIKFCLQSKEYKYLGEALVNSPRELIKIRNFGQVCLKEFKDFVNKKGLTFEVEYTKPEDR